MQLTRPLFLPLVTVMSIVGLLAEPRQSEASFPGANGKIAFVSLRDGQYEIYAMEADGTNPIRLTDNPATDESPRWSSDGTKIAFDSDRDGNWEVYVMNADGTGQANLTNNPAVDIRPARSPDGTKIVFQSTRDGQYEIYVMNADGASPVRLTNNPANDEAPKWSPDGTTIAFASDRDGQYEIYVMNADGTNPVRLTNGPGVDTYPDWSPDGTKIAFASNRTGQYEIYMMNADGTGVTQLTNNVVPDGASVPSWSPDGTKIAFQSQTNFANEIYAMNADGTGVTQLTNNTVVDQLPDWQALPTISVAIDIKPGSLPNTINPTNKGKTPVAILSSPDFDALSDVNTTSLRFGRTGNELSLAFCSPSPEDVNGDGLLDLVCHFTTQATGFQTGDTQGVLKASTTGGIPITGTDSVGIVPPK